MKNMFYLSCFIPEGALHRTMTFLESQRAANLDVRTVKNGAGGPAPEEGEGRKSAYTAVVDFVAKKHPATVPEIRAALVEEGFAASSVNNAIQNALKFKLIKRKSRGEYTKP